MSCNKIDVKGVSVRMILYKYKLVIQVSLISYIADLCVLTPSKDPKYILRL